MTTRKKPAFMRSVLVLSLAVGALALVARTPVLEAQGRSDLEARHQRLLPLFELSDVVYTDADETRGRLVVGVLNRRGGEGQVRGRLRALGIDIQSVDVVETDAIFALATLSSRSEDIVGGLQIRFSQYLCSLGFPAFRKGVLGFVTASHCSTNQGGVDGTTYYQPLDQLPNDIVGTEIADPAYVRNAAGCPKGKKCRWSDANFSRGAGTRGLRVGVIARTTGLNSLVIDTNNPPFTITGETEAAFGAAVDKVGRTTGWTQGNVSNTCVNTGVQGTSIVLRCQTFVTSTNGSVIVGSGDSGSPAFINDGSTVRLVGGLWGGNAAGTQFVYSPIANIESELGALDTFQN